jgi:hypothetical protein
MRDLAGHRSPTAFNSQAAGLSFVLEEIGPSTCNQAVTHVPQRLQERIAGLDIDFRENGFGFLAQFDESAKPR